MASTRPSPASRPISQPKASKFFDEIDQTKLGASAKLPINRSTLLLFGNPPLGVQFLQSNPVAGLDWPVRMLVTQDDDGTVWISWTDFRFVANRYQLNDRDAQIEMATRSLRLDRLSRKETAMKAPSPLRSIRRRPATPGHCRHLRLSQSQSTARSAVDACVNNPAIHLDRLTAAARMQ